MKRSMLLISVFLSIFLLHGIRPVTALEGVTGTRTSVLVSELSLSNLPAAVISRLVPLTQKELSKIIEAQKKLKKTNPPAKPDEIAKLMATIDADIQGILGNRRSNIVFSWLAAAQRLHFLGDSPDLISHVSRVHTDSLPNRFC